MNNLEIKDQLIRELTGSTITYQSPTTLIIYSSNQAELINSPSNYRKSTPCIRRLNKDTYVNTNTGEIKNYKYHTERSNKSFNKSFRTIKEKILCNFNARPNEKFVTLTFDNELAPISLKFTLDVDQNKEIARYCQKQLNLFFQRLSRLYNYDNHKLIHICIMEPQKNGTPHYHLLLKLLNADKFKLNESQLSQLWQQGYVNLKPLTNVNNLPAYFHAHLTDLPSNEASTKELNNYQEIQRKVNGQSKKFLKGARLQYFPADINYFSCSKGLRTSVRKQLPAEQARDILDKKGMQATKGIKYKAYSKDGHDTYVRREIWQVPAPEK